MKAEEYTSYDALGLAKLIRDKEVTAEELLRSAIDQIASTNEELNAVIRPMYDEAATTIKAGLPDGPFKGVPFLIKDLGLLYKGVPTTAGSRFFEDNVPDHDSNLVTRYKEAGLVICGKTNTPELGLATTTEPVLFGASKNPSNTAYSTGGSSGGSGAAVAAGYVPIASASDGGGSIRIPASACGLFGIKPTRGRTPMGPDVGEGWNGSSCLHAVSRTVRDSAALLDATAGEDVGAPYFAPYRPRAYLEEIETPPAQLRIALVTTSFNEAPVNQEVAAAAQHAAKLCEDLGHHVQEARPDIDPAALRDGHGTVVVGSIAGTISAREKALGRACTIDDVEHVTWLDYRAGHQISAADYVQAVVTVHKLGRRMAEFFERYDVILSPTMASPLQKLGILNMNSTDMATYNATIMPMIAFTSVFNVAGCPAMSVPLAKDSNGLPLGIQFAAAMGGEALLLKLAAQLEQAYPWGNN